jgi:hypothetical protein
MIVKRIAQVTYWLGLICATLALIFRFANMFGYEFAHISTRGNSVDVRSYLDAALLFLFTSIASSLYARVEP